MSGDVRIVQIEGHDRAHLVRLGVHWDGTGKALCGRKPFPERWGIVLNPEDRKDACTACLRAR